MTRRHQWMLVAGIVATVAAGIVAAVMVAGDRFRIGAGSKAPDFAAVTLDSPGVRRSLSEYKGRVILLNIWATFCEPCKVEMPSLEQLHCEFGNNGLSIVAVSVDAPNADNTIREFVTGLGLTFDVLHDSTDAIKSAYKSFGFPETYIIDRKGVIVAKVWGFRPGIDEWTSPANRALIAHLLSEGSDPVPPPPRSAAIRLPDAVEKGGSD